MASKKKDTISFEEFDDTPTVTEPAEEAPEAPREALDGDVYEEIRGILSPQKGKRAVPTLVSFHSPTANVRRYVIVDINCELLREAYERWKAHGGTDDEVFLDYVYKVTRTDVPRMYRAVAPLDLER